MCAVIGLAFVLAASPVAATDLTGTWRVEHSATRVQYVPLLDQSGTVTGTFPGLAAFLGGTWTFAGTFVEATSALQGNLYYLPFSTMPGGDVDALVFPDGNHFDGELLAQTGFGGENLRTVANRCECLDGNELNGDGCDASCRVEPCFSCAG
ncbi:MAG TPA: hypothetical protein VGC36_09990, partial [Rhizomicrobium sp.]